MMDGMEWSIFPNDLLFFPGDTQGLDQATLHHGISYSIKLLRRHPLAGVGLAGPVIPFNPASSITLAVDTDETCRCIFGRGSGSFARGVFFFWA